MADINEAASRASEQAAAATQRARELGRQAMSQGADTAREYMERGRGAMSDAAENLSEFVRRDPWLALLGAFVIGYVAAKVIKRLS
jgi:ElaB/YqjD/DUF883 family membrane-anchored ribosome-binding protein